MNKNKRTRNNDPKKMASKTTKIAAIAGLTLTCGMILSEISPAVANATTLPNNTTNVQVGKPGDFDGTDTHDKDPEPTPPDYNKDHQIHIDSTDSTDQAGHHHINVQIDNSHVEQTSQPTYNWYVTKTNELHISGSKLESDSFSKLSKKSTEKITKIIFDTKIAAPENASGLFSQFINLEDLVNINNLDISQAKSLSKMFKNTSLVSLDLSSWKIADSTDVSGMFENTFLTSLKVNSQFKLGDTSLVNDSLIGNDPYKWVFNDKNRDINVLSTSEILKESPNLKNDEPTLFTRIIRSNKTLTRDVELFTNLKSKVYSEKSVTGFIGTIIQINVPKIKGFTANKKVVNALVTEYDIKVIDPQNTGKVVYKSDSTNPTVPSTPSTGGAVGSSSSSAQKPDKDKTPKPTEKPTIKKAIRKITVHATTKSGSLFSKSLHRSNRSIGTNTSWYSDQEMTIGGKTYFRVSTNEWVSADDVYEYSEQKHTVVTKDDTSSKDLVNSRGKRVANRGLAKNTAWASDRIVTINGKTYHRVSTNEFVAASDVIVK